MQILMHLCGQQLERGTNGAYFHLIPVLDRVMRADKVQRCPRCNEWLDDTDMADRAGVPLALDSLPPWAVARRAVLADLATASYVLGWEKSAWHIRQAQRDEDVASAATLEAIIERARTITTGADPGGDAPMVA
jgi:hypothetical protein